MLMVLGDHSHFCDWDAPGRLVVRAVCGILIRRRDHADAPSCPVCQKVIRRRETEDAETESEGSDAVR